MLLQLNKLEQYSLWLSCFLKMTHVHMIPLKKILANTVMSHDEIIGFLQVSWFSQKTPSRWLLWDSSTVWSWPCPLWNQRSNQIRPLLHCLENIKTWLNLNYFIAWMKTYFNAKSWCKLSFCEFPYDMFYFKLGNHMNTSKTSTFYPRLMEYLRKLKNKKLFLFVFYSSQVQLLSVVRYIHFVHALNCNFIFILLYRTLVQLVCNCSWQLT